jgi:hypothetical protein
MTHMGCARASIFAFQPRMPAKEGVPCCTRRFSQREMRSRSNSRAAWPELIGSVHADQEKNKPDVLHQAVWTTHLLITEAMEH